VQKRSKILLITSVALWLFCYNAWHFFGQEWFEIGQAIIIYASALLLFWEHKNKTTLIFKIIATNQLFDEFFSNPLEVSWNEYLTAFLIILVGVFPTSWFKSIFQNKSK
jgi:predicted membrane protein